MSEEKNMTARDMRSALLCKNAIWVIEYKLARATNNHVAIQGVDDKHLADIWEAVVPMIHKLNDIEEIKAESAKDVISLLGKGKIDSGSAIKLMDVLKSKQDIEEMPRLIALLEGKIKDEQGTSDTTGKVISLRTSKPKEVS